MMVCRVPEKSALRGVSGTSRDWLVDLLFGMCEVGPRRPEFVVGTFCFVFRGWIS